MSDFSKFILRVEEGTEPKDESHMIHVDHKFVVAGESISDLVASTYGDIRVNYNNPDYISCRSLMCPKNDTTDFINQYVMNLIPGEASSLLSTDSVNEEQAAMYPTEFLNYITPNGLRPYRLYLRFIILLSYCVVLIRLKECVTALG